MAALEEYIVLRQVEPEGFPFAPTTSRGGEPGERSAPPGRRAGTIQVGLQRISRADREDLARERGTLATAPPMPIRLVKPVSRQKAAPRTAPGPVWGVQAVGADRSRFTGKGIVVAVLDTGIDAEHKAFKDMEVFQKDFTGTGLADEVGHGTHCAGTLFGQDVDGVRIGVAVGIQKAVIAKVLTKNGGSTAAIVDALRWAVEEHGAHVVSMSLGIDFQLMVARLEKELNSRDIAVSEALAAYRDTVKLFDSLSKFVEDGAAFRADGTLLVAAAGNESRRQLRPDWTIRVSPPANAQGFVSVAALQRVGTSPPTLAVAEFSNIGARIAAPGVDVISAAIKGGLTSLSGTSMATPHVAGVAALWAEKLRTETGRVDAHELRERVLGSAQRPSHLSAPDVGNGLVQAPS